MIPNYTKYKQTGLDWMPEIPEHWEVYKLKFSDDVIMGQSPSSDAYNEKKNGIPFLQGNAEFGGLYPKEKLHTTNITKIAPINSILYSVRAPIGAVNISDKDYCIGRGLAAIRPIKNNLKFLYYISLQLKHVLNRLGTGSTFIAISVGDLKNVKIPIPPINEQLAIANFLDYKCEQIDRFITKKQQVIALLKEQKTAIINKAVTKGLNPDAPMKDLSASAKGRQAGSGIEWLGKIPEHWEMRKLKYCVRLNNRKLDKHHRGFKLALENIESWSGQYVQSDNIPFEGEGTPFETVDVLFSKLRPYLAKVFIPDSPGMAVNELLVLTPNEKIISKYYLFYRLISPDFIWLVNSSTYGAKMPRASWNFIGNQTISIPPLNEQQELVKQIKAESEKIHQAISRAEKEIELIKEYRESLIAEAVLGKIDVRDTINKQIYQTA